MSARKEELTVAIDAQAAKVRQLKAQGAEKAIVDPEAAALRTLHQELAALEGSKKTKTAKNTFTLKTAKVSSQILTKSHAHALFSLFFRVQKITMTRTWRSVKRCFPPSPKYSKSMVR
jgi:hypothetical protein